MYFLKISPNSCRPLSDSGKDPVSCFSFCWKWRGGGGLDTTPFSWNLRATFNILLFLSPQETPSKWDDSNMAPIAGLKQPLCFYLPVSPPPHWKNVIRHETGFVWFATDLLECLPIRLTFIFPPLKLCICKSTPNDSKLTLLKGGKISEAKQGCYLGWETDKILQRNTMPNHLCFLLKVPCWGCHKLDCPMLIRLLLWTVASRCRVLWPWSD